MEAAIQPSTSAPDTHLLDKPEKRKKKNKKRKDKDGTESEPSLSLERPLAAMTEEEAMQEVGGNQTMYGREAAFDLMAKKGEETEGRASASKKRRKRKADEEGAAASLSWHDDYFRTNVKSGRYSSEEISILKASVMRFAEAHSLSTEDLSWVCKLRETVGKTGGWKEIAKDLPSRRIHDIRAKAIDMFNPNGKKGRFSAEEDETLIRLVDDYGKKWTRIGDEMNRDVDSVFSRYQAIKNKANLNHGPWTREEDMKLREIVTKFLSKKKALAGHQAEDGDEGSLTKSKHSLSGGKDRREILDGVDWSTVAELLGTRNEGSCRRRWSAHLAPSMVERGDWGAGDDKRLLAALWCSGASEEYEVGSMVEGGWGGLVPGRAQEAAKRRWVLMKKSVPGSGMGRSFEEVVDFLVEKYYPKLKEPDEEEQEEEDA